LSTSQAKRPQRFYDYDETRTREEWIQLMLEQNPYVDRQNSVFRYGTPLMFWNILNRIQVVDGKITRLPLPPHFRG
jgi:hypothetical protein